MDLMGENNALSADVIKGAEHTFQTKHPWTADKLPEDMLNVLNKTIAFFNQD